LKDLCPDRLEEIFTETKTKEKWSLKCAEGRRSNRNLEQKGLKCLFVVFFLKLSRSSNGGGNYEIGTI